MQTPSRLTHRALRASPFPKTGAYLNPSGGAAQIQPGPLEQVHLCPGVIVGPQNVAGEGVISLFSYLQGRTVLKPSQTDG